MGLAINVIQVILTANMLDKVKETQIWQEHVKKEAILGKQWQENWGYQLEFNKLGEKVERPSFEGVEGQSFYTDKLPLTEMKKIGNRVKTSSLLIDAERQFQPSANKKQKLKAEFLVQ